MRCEESLETNCARQRQRPPPPPPLNYIFKLFDNQNRLKSKNIVFRQSGTHLGTRCTGIIAYISIWSDTAVYRAGSSWTRALEDAGRAAHDQLVERRGQVRNLAEHKVRLLERERVHE